MPSLYQVPLLVQNILNFYRWRVRVQNLNNEYNRRVQVIGNNLVYDTEKCPYYKHRNNQVICCLERGFYHDRKKRIYRFTEPTNRKPNYPHNRKYYRKPVPKTSFFLPRKYHYSSGHNGVLGYYYC